MKGAEEHWNTEDGEVLLLWTIILKEHVLKMMPGLYTFLLSLFRWHSFYIYLYMRVSKIVIDFSLCLSKNVMAL